MFGWRISRASAVACPLEPQTSPNSRSLGPWLRAAPRAVRVDVGKHKWSRSLAKSCGPSLIPPSRAIWLGFAVLAASAVLSAGSRAADQQAPPGAEIYKQSGCVVCHGGLGTGGFGPKLSGDPMLAISPFVVAQILIGRGQMPPYGEKLSDAQIAAVAQYIRTNWGNDFGPVTADQVADTRNLMQRAAQIAAQASQPRQ